jgi:hypothetical protein
MCKLWRFNRTITAKFPFWAALLPHNFRFSPHFCRTISVFRRTFAAQFPFFAAQFGVIAKCGAALFGKNYRT